MAAPYLAGDRPMCRAAYYARDGFSLQIRVLLPSPGGRRAGPDLIRGG
jgi:hypothetical protein